ncbi:odorant receptor 43a-like [Vespa mandarinia]|uniref:odorant receptor 43a-like n=1 Tax=Vespa mandarinia TaxID=7446 RepID=UPI001621C1F2|nr:odorant receptor 43a-like [Vespa mandarinia]
MIVPEMKHLEEKKSRVIAYPNKIEFALNYSIQIGRCILKVIGAWPLYNESSNIEKFYSYFAKGFCYFLFIFILVPGLLRIFLIEQNTRIRLKIFGPLCTCSINATKYSILITRGKKIEECMKHIREDWKKVVLEKDYESMISHAKVGRTLAVMSASFIYGAGMSYRTILPLSKGKQIIGNLTIRPIACPSYFVIFDEQKSPAYELVFFGQFLAGFAVYSVACGVCGLATFLIMHACGQLEILMRMMRDIVDGKDDVDDTDPDTRIAEVIRHQIRSKNFVKEVEEVLQYMCMVEIVGCNSLVCLVLYDVVMEWENSDTTGLIIYLIFLLSFAFNMFIFCYIGELLSEQGAKVGITSCTLEWNRLPTKSAQSLILIILASNHPIKIVAGKLMHMSLSNFNGIIKTSVGYFNILRNST